MPINSQPFKYLTPWTPESPLQPKTQVVTCFLESDGLFLALQRARNDAQYGLWGIPGGKLSPNESPIQGLCRELEEETSLKLPPSSFQLLGTSLSQTPSDGQYGLYLFYTKLPSRPAVQIQLEEHLAFTWVSLENLENLPLLTAQGEAILSVKTKLILRQKGSYV